MSTTDVGIPQLIFNKMSQAKYNELKAAGQLSSTEFYITDGGESGLSEKVYIQEQILNRTYTGRNLVNIFADEIANYANVWAWIKNRITNANWSGLYVGDYIPVTMNAGTVGGISINSKTFQCQIAGIDTYYAPNYPSIYKHHIDFISREVTSATAEWNPTASNNGTADNNYPWLASNIYAWLNGVNNYTTNAYDNMAHGGDYSSGGILQLLPTELTNLIVTKNTILEKRYSNSGALSYSTSYGSTNMGKLWLPTEIEVYGTQIYSIPDKGSNNGGMAKSETQYPLFANNFHTRDKMEDWPLSSIVAGDSNSVCFVKSEGASYHNTATASRGVPLCFRIS